ncbi:MAG TPA: flagellar basal body rod protein FlgB [Polyangiaceae bacterium]|nr:flagellar basal body rod protein FlgB [Polyangiaceae bacterium]
MSDIFNGISPLHAALDYHLERHNVLASNVAHVDTPGYVPKDLERVANAPFDDALRVAMERTDPSHFAGHAPLAATTGRVFEDPAAGAGNDKNFVSLDREAAKLAANQVRYDVASTLASAELAQLAYAASDGKGM